MNSEERKPIGFVTAEVKFPIFAGDDLRKFQMKVSASDGPDRFGFSVGTYFGSLRKCETLSVNIQFRD